jgi:hypothetical protein
LKTAAGVLSAENVEKAESILIELYQMWKVNVNAFLPNIVTLD